MLIRRREIRALLNLVAMASEYVNAEADRVPMTATFRGFVHQLCSPNQIDAYTGFGVQPTLTTRLHSVTTARLI